MTLVLVLILLYVAVLVFVWGLCAAAGRTLPSPGPRDAENGRTGVEG